MTIRAPITALAAALALSLAACSGGNTPAPDTSEAAQPVETTTPDATESTVITDESAFACNADAVQSLVGQEATEELLEQARIDSGATLVRSLRPGEAATMEFRPDRLDVTLDENGVIEVLRCG